ncbi:hypothetical protein FRB95_007304 [Tulasnella sp. JGI-2019a]|nr:hypothetical protein FRB95_007304 [Tulasnella sp. JGI-2019a]
MPGPSFSRAEPPAAPYYLAFYLMALAPLNLPYTFLTQHRVIRVSPLEEDHPWVLSAGEGPAYQAEECSRSCSPL